MKNRIFLLGAGVGVVVLAAALVFWVIPGLGQKDPGSVGPSITLPAALSAGLAQPVSETLVEPANKSAAEDWSAAPDCAVDPLTADEWNQRLADPAQAGAQALTLQRANQFAAPSTDAAAASGLQTAQGTTGQSEYTALLLNVASGRLNRATEISLDGFPEIKTIGDLLDRYESTPTAQLAPDAQAQTASPSLAEASRGLLEGKGIVKPVCARLLVTQAGNQIDDVEWSDQGLAAETVRAETPGQAYKVIGEGAASPDGEWAAFRSGGQDTGGPVFLLNLKTSEWTNLIEAMRATSADPSGLPESYSGWDLIGWMPNSQRVVIGPSDLPWIFVVDLQTYAYQALPLNTFGLGGSDLVHLSPDGSQVVYIGNDTSGAQQLTTLNLASGETVVRLSSTFEQGVLQTPRFSPDGKSIAYVVQKGQPLTGMTYAIHRFVLEQGADSLLIDGNLGVTRPVWSPDGLHIAFTRKANDEPDVVSPDQVPQAEPNHLWVISIADGKAWQVTMLEGQVNSPAWANDGKTLSFVTEQGQVGLVDIQQPGQTWKAAGSATDLPSFTSTFFVP